jgi:hypothetical protein
MTPSHDRKNHMGSLNFTLISRFHVITQGFDSTKDSTHDPGW